MNDQPDTNLDLLTDPVADAPQPEAPEAPEVQLRTDGPTLSEFVAAGYLAENYPPTGYAAVTEVQPVPTFVEAVDPQPVDQHAESGYRPVTGREIKDYLDAKGMGLKGRPSKSEVTEFLAAKRGT